MTKENAVITMNRLAINHGAQTLFAKRLYAVIKLRIPINPRCGGKFVRGKNASRIMPVTA